MPSKSLLPSAQRALALLAEARRGNTLHSRSWRSLLNDNAPEMASVVSLEDESGLRMKRFAPSADDVNEVLLVAAPNEYAETIDEFEAGARHLAEALQRPVLLVDPMSIAFSSANGQILHPQSVLDARRCGVVTEGGALAAFELWSERPQFRNRIACLTSIHPPVGALMPRWLPTYRVALDPAEGPTWHGLPAAPLALSRWIPEIDTYLDPLRIWCDLHLS